MSIPVDQLPTDDVRRDRWGRMLVVPPDGGKPVGYTRVTTVAKATDDGGGLMPWKATMAVCGAMMRPGLRAQWEALLSAHDGRPWYAGKQPKAACKKLVEECAEAGGATDRRDQGIALHAIAAQLDRGEVVRHLSAETQADVHAYRAALVAAGITMRADLVERHVVLDTFAVGGGPDRVADVPGYKLPMIADLKTGEELTYSWGSIAVQLAAYAHAEALYEQGADPNGSADVRATMPAVDLDHGLVMHLPAGGARCDLYIVDIAAGWEAFQLSMKVRDWRNTKNLAVPLDQAAPPDVSQDMDAPYADDYIVNWRVWLQTRINVAGRHSDTCRADLLRSWPLGVPSLTSSGYSHSLDQLAAIEVTLDAVEARHSVPFGAPKPGTTPPDPAEVWAGKLLQLFPNSTVITEETP